jgi:serine/threonine protein kinase
VFWQVVDALAQAEQWTSFEVSTLTCHYRNRSDSQHRDLHEGQILISPSPVGGSSAELDCLSESQTGVKVTIIDFGLSRLTLPGKTSSTWSELPVEVYEGKGDQWDVYRSMRDQIAGDWAGFHPESNVLVRLNLFLRCLADKNSGYTTSSDISSTERNHYGNLAKPVQRVGQERTLPVNQISQNQGLWRLMNA